MQRDCDMNSNVLTVTQAIIQAKRIDLVTNRDDALGRSEIDKGEARSLLQSSPMWHVWWFRSEERAEIEASYNSDMVEPGLVLAS